MRHEIGVLSGAIRQTLHGQVTDVAGDGPIAPNTTFNSFQTRALATPYQSQVLPGAVVPHNPHLSKTKTGAVKFDGSGNNSWWNHGGGGDIPGRSRYNLEIFIPESLGRFVYGKPVVIVYTLQWTFGNSPEFKVNPDWSFVVDSSHLLDHVVLLGTQTIASNQQTRAVLIKVWGLMRPYIPSASFLASFSVDWITNYHDDGWKVFGATVSIDFAIEGSGAKLRQKTVEGFDMVYVDED